MRSTISTVMWPVFIRNDWQDPILFILLRLSICLNSAGVQAWSHVYVCRTYDRVYSTCAICPSQAVVQCTAKHRASHITCQRVFNLSVESPVNRTTCWQTQCLQYLSGMRMLLPLRQTNVRIYSDNTLCVEIPMDSRNRTIHNVYHISLHSSSNTEPTHKSIHDFYKKNFE